MDTGALAAVGVTDNTAAFKAPLAGSADGITIKKRGWKVLLNIPE